MEEMWCKLPKVNYLPLLEMLEVYVSGTNVYAHVN